MLVLLRKIAPTAAYVGVVALFAAASYYLVYREFSLVAQGLSALGVIALAAYVSAARTEILGALTSRQARSGSNAIVMIVAFVAIMVLLNFLATRHGYRWDLTETQEYSLSPQTAKVLADLREPVHVIGFFSDADGRRQMAQDLLKEYAARGDKLTYEFVDPDLRPTVAQQYQIRNYGLLFLSGDRRQDVMGVGESDFTNALLKVSGAEEKKIVFVGGHGERDIYGYGDDSYSRAMAALEADNYAVTAISLVEDPLGDDVAAVVLAGPRTPLLDQERQVLRDYLRGGGKVMLLYDAGDDAQLDDLLLEYGVSLGYDLVLDPARALFPDVGTPIIMEYGWSPITKDLPQTVFPTVAAITLPAEPTPGISVTPLARTSDKSWVEKDLSNPRYDEGVDIAGPLSIAVAIEAEVAPAEDGQQADPAADAPERRVRLVVVADSDFAADAFLNLAGNRDFFVNSVNWLTETEELISIRPKPPEMRSVFLTTTQSNLVLFSSVVLLPLLVLVAGGWVWWSRR